MNLLNKYMGFCAVLLIILPVILSTLNSDEITSTDWVYRHTVWIDYYLHGDFRPILQYPPLFHWLMLPFVAIDFPMKYFQIIFSILTISGIIYYLRKNESEKMMLFSLMMLATSITFIEYSGSLMPQGLDYFFFSLMLIFYFKGNDNKVLLLGLIVMLMHVIGIIYFTIFAIHSFLTKRNSWKKYLIMLLMLTPIAIYYIVPTFNLHLLDFAWDWVAQAEWDAQFLEPINFIIHSGFLIWILLPFALRNWYREKFKFTEKELLYVIWICIFVLLPIGNFGIWRMITYQILPISLLTASLVSKDEIYNARRFRS